jgi:Flp pilus assembly protein TadB
MPFRVTKRKKGRVPTSEHSPSYKKAKAGADVSRTTVIAVSVTVIVIAAVVIATIAGLWWWRRRKRMREESEGERGG